MNQCTICSNPTTLRYKLSSDILYCGSCTLFLAPKVTFNKSFQSEINQEKAALALKDLRISNFREIVQHIKKDLPENAKGLDIGCSYGWFLEVCKDNQIACIGMEPEPGLARQATANGYTVIQGFFPDDLNGQANNVDFIIFNDVFEHIPDIRKTVESCHQLLAKNGTLIINLPLSTGFFYKTAGVLYKLGIRKPMERLWQLQFHSPHFHYFNKNNLTRFLQANGFKLEKFHHLATITKDSIKSRVEMNKKQTLGSKITITLLKLMQPVINKLPSDIGCFYFKKSA